MPFSDSPKEISKHRLLEEAKVTATIYKELQDKGIFENYEVETGRLATPGNAVVPQNELNKAQAKAFEDIKEVFSKKNVNDTRTKEANVMVNIFVASGFSPKNIFKI